MTILNNPISKQKAQAVTPKLNDYTYQIAQLNTMVSDMEETQSKILPKNTVGLSLDYFDIRQYLDGISLNRKRFFVIEKDDEFEIVRTVDNCSLKKVYEILTPNIKTFKRTTAEKIVLDLLKKYIAGNHTDAMKTSSCISESMFYNRIFSYSWIQRKATRTALFKYSGLPTELLKKTLDDMVHKGLIEEVDPKKFNINAKIYKILDEALIESSVDIVIEIPSKDELTLSNDDVQRKWLLNQIADDWE